MNLRALVVEDDAGIMPAVEDVLFSMGHRLTWVTNQFDAQGAVAKEKFDYVLLDLAIPARPGGEADQQFGINLLEYFQQYDGLPVLIMTAYLAACVDLGNQLRELGARDTIAKPFKQRGRELAQKIRKMLAGGNGQPSRRAKVSQPTETTSFQGGELVFFANRVVLQGVTIITDRGTGQCMMVLEQLRQRDARGRYVRRSGEDLAQLIGAPGGGSSVAAFVHTLRGNIAQRLRRDLGIDVAPDAVIDHSDQGYFLREWIVVRDGTERCDSGVGETPSVDVQQSPWNERQAWVLSELQRGARVERSMIEKRFDVTSKTAQRDLTGLSLSGCIEFVRKGRTGYYRAIELQLADLA
jgi:DNA-binding response OmpR family regulator